MILVSGDNDGSRRTPHHITNTKEDTHMTTTSTNITTNITEDTIRQTMASMGYDTGWLWDLADTICDYDEACQRATDIIAHALGLPTLAEAEAKDEDAYDDPRYELVNEVVNDLMTLVTTTATDDEEDYEEDYED